MKKILFLFLATMAITFALSACSDTEPFSTATANDEPRILDPIFPDRVNGELPVVANISRDAHFTMKLTVTPADFTTVTWLLDGEEVATGVEIDKALSAGTYRLKVIVITTAGKSTWREGTVQVNPLADDPWTGEVSFERIVAPGTTARLYGSNLDKVASITIGGKTIADVKYLAVDNCLEYTVPADLVSGDYRVLLNDSDGNSYGGNKVKVTAEPIVTSGANRANAGAEWVLTGINLDRIASLTLGDHTVTSFIRRTSSELVLTCPLLADGNYSLIGKTEDGQTVQFVNGQTISTELTVAISSEQTLWEGHHYVSWDEPDGSPHKTFNLIGQDKFATIAPGSVLRISYSLNAADSYHKMQVATGWWTMLPGTVEKELATDGVLELILTKKMLDLIGQQAGFLCVGHGYYVDRVSVQ